VNVTPHINPQGLVTLDVYPEISTATGATVAISNTVQAPLFAIRSAQSRVAIRDGQTIVIGGLMEDRVTESVDKVPLLGDIPLVGSLFRHTVKNKSKTELLIFLTPHVAEAPDLLPGMSKDEISGLKLTPKAVAPGVYEEHMRGLERGAASRPADANAPDNTWQPMGQDLPSNRAPSLPQIQPPQDQPPQDQPPADGTPPAATQQAAPPDGTVLQSQAPGAHGQRVARVIPSEAMHEKN
jgi:general secretion pathway protein D